jgi:diamine N-acetyltransferase
MCSPTHVRIATATHDDLPAVSALAHEIWRRHYPPIVGAEQTEYLLTRMYSATALEELVNAPGSVLELLFVDDRLAGYVAFGPSADAAELKLDKLYVHHAYHGAGYGNRLIARVVAEAVRRGCGAIVLNVHQRNVIAIRAYERNGFVVRRAFSNDFGNGHVMDDLEMVKALHRG